MRIICSVLSALIIHLAPAATLNAQPVNEAMPFDFSGTWFPAGFGQRSPDPLPFTEAAQDLVAQYENEFLINDDPGRFCIWPGIPRALWGAPFVVEIIHRPQDVTVYFEGYGMYRKIYMADHNPPEPILPTAMGHSVSRWEQDSDQSELVISTTHLLDYPYMNRLPTSSSATVEERWRLETRAGEDGEPLQYLIAEATLTDPKVYTEPVRIIAEAVLRPDLNVLEYNCSRTLWEEHLTERGLQLPDLDSLP